MVEGVDNKDGTYFCNPGMTAPSSRNLANHRNRSRPDGYSRDTASTSHLRGPVQQDTSSLLEQVLGFVVNILENYTKQ